MSPNSNLPKTQAPIVRLDGGRALTNSRDVATYFDKRHDNVLRDIDSLRRDMMDLPAPAAGALLSFEEGSYTLEVTGGQQHRCFDMDRDGFTLLAIGFTGSEALKFKINYIWAFNAMEAALARPPVLGNAESRAIIDLLTEHLHRLETPAIAAPVEFTTLGFSIKHGIPTDLKTQQRFGKKSTKVAHDTGATIHSIQDARYGSIHSYSEDVLARAAKELGLTA